MYILGISSYYHDSAACLLKNGNILAAAQEERFTRKKHDSDFPSNSIIYCLNEAKISANEITNTAINVFAKDSDKPIDFNKAPPPKTNAVALFPLA